MKKVTVEWQPNKQSKEPLYKQIVNFISMKISNGDWAIGSFIPPERSLSKIFQVNRSTVTEALDILKTNGILQGIEGKGTIIASNTWSLAISQNHGNWGSYVKSGYFKENIPTIQEINRMEFKEDIIRLGTGELSPDLYPSKMMKEIFNKTSGSINSLSYLEPLGLLELRTVLAEKLKEKGIVCSSSNILITTGSLQALHLISVGILDEKSTVYAEDPSYLKSIQVFQSAGVHLHGIDMDSEGIEYWKITSEHDENKNSFLYTIPSFHNPSGVLMSENRRKELFSYCYNNRLPIIEDDAYGDIWFEESPPKPLKSMDDFGMVLYLGTISKTLAPGLRLGWMVGPEAIVNRLGDIKMQTDYGASSVSQWILKEILSDSKYNAYLDCMRASMKCRRNKMLQSLDKYFNKIADWNIPTGSFYIWLNFKKEIPIEKLFYLSLNEGLLLNPGNIYNFKKSNTLRLSYSYIEEEQIEESIKKLSHLVQSL